MTGAVFGVLAGEVDPTVVPPDEGTVVGAPDVFAGFEGEWVDVERPPVGAAEPFVVEPGFLPGLPDVPRVVGVAPFAPVPEVDGMVDDELFAAVAALAMFDALAK